jgi:hypothetical protein
MHLMAELLVAAHEADIARDVRARRFQRLIATCRRRLFGVLAVGPSCAPCATC